MASRCGGSLFLGKRGETGVVRVLFPLYEDFDEVVVLHKRANDEHPYAVPNMVTDNGIEWVVDLADTAVVGVGSAEVIYKKNGSVAKSVTYTTRVAESIDDGDYIVPTAAESWVQYVAELTASAQLAERGAEAAAEAARGSKDAAEAAAQAAEAQAGRAEQAAAGIGEAVDQAEQARDSAVQAAGEALEKANAAQESAGNAGIQAAYAKGHADRAAESAAAAQSARDAAAERAENAQSFTENAAASAESAQTSAQEAQTAAEQARVDVAAETAARTIADAEINRKVDMLYKISEGVLWDIEQREESGAAQLPKGGEYGNVDEVRGKTEQESTNGYQLISANETFSEVSSIQYSTENGTEWKVKGTATADAYLSRGISNAASVVANGFYIESGTYTFSWSGTAVNGVIAQILTTDGTSAITSSVIGSLSTMKSRTVTIDKGLYCYPRIVVSAGATVDEKYTLMLEKGSTAHPYEPYTGGIPSPNPEYPQEIVSVDSFTVRCTDADGNILDKRTITPPRPLNAIGEHKDICDVANGVWEYIHKKINLKNLGLWTFYNARNNVLYSPIKDIAFLANTIVHPLMMRKFKAEDWQRASFNDVWIAVYKYETSSNPLLAVCSGGRNFNTTNEFVAEFGDEVLTYAASEQTTEPISPDDLEWLRNLTLNEGENLFITDNHGRDVSYLMSDFINLRKAVEQ